jgi:endonuclease-8
MIRFDDGNTLHTHMRMSGTWQVHRAGERWRRPAHQARVVLATDDGWEAVCFDAPVIDFGPTRLEGGWVGHLGPDLCRVDADIEVAVERFGLLDPSTELGVALLDQRVACGVGNVYKSEVAFAVRVDPFTPLAAIDVATRRVLVETAARLLRANVERARRTTVAGGLAVYGRAGRPCRRCGTLVRSRRQGEDARTTYWCPRCQPVAATGAPTDE